LTFNYDIRGSENESEKDEKARDEELVNISLCKRKRVFSVGDEGGIPLFLTENGKEKNKRCTGHPIRSMPLRCKFSEFNRIKQTIFGMFFYNILKIY